MKGEQKTRTTVKLEALTLIGLLALEAWAGPTGVLASLRHEAHRESDSDRAHVLGYYEGLIAIGGNPRPKPRRRTTPTLAPLPPGYVPFEVAGIVDDAPGFLHWKLKTGVNLRWNGTTFRTNDLGYRGPDISLRKPAGTYRVVVLGSSNTLGQGVDDEEGYVRRLEGWLTTKAEPGQRVEVVNLSASGYALTQRLHRLVNEVAALDPDWILSDASALDLVLEEMHLRWALGTGTPIPFESIRTALSQAGLSASDTPKQFGHKFHAVRLSLVDETYARIAAQARSLGVPLTVVLLPRFDSEGHRRNANRLIRAAVEHNGLECLDLTDVLDGRPLESYQIGPWETHPNARGHQALFEALRQQLDRPGKIPGLTNPGRARE